MRNGCVVLLSLLTTVAAQAQIDDSAHAQASEAEPARGAAPLTREGAFLPQTLPAAIGDRRVYGLFMGGYDGGPLGGGTFSALLEGAIFNRVALRVGVQYLNPLGRVEPSVGARVALLRQDRHRLDLSVAASYNNVGFTEASGEFEFVVAASHRWNRVALIGNVAYGQGLTAAERDGEVRVAALVLVHRLVNVGLDARARFDLGADTPGRVKDQLESDFDFLGGPLCSIALGHFAVVAQAGAHSVLRNERSATGVAAFGGLGATY